MNQSLPGLKKVAFINCSRLPQDITLRALSNLPVAILTTAEEIPLEGDALCETESIWDNNSSLEKTTLTFLTHAVLPTFNPLAFIIETVDQKQYVIGSRELPFPTVKVSYTSGATDGEPTVKKYEVTFSVKKSLVLCSK